MINNQNLEHNQRPGKFTSFYFTTPHYYEKIISPSRYTFLPLTDPFAFNQGKLPTNALQLNLKFAVKAVFQEHE